MIPATLLVTLGLTVIFALLSYKFKKQNFNLDAEQRLFMIISNIMLILIFGKLGSHLLHNPDLIHIVSTFSIFYILWYYTTFVIVNYLSSDNNGVLRY